jgi:hypothetical protein
MHVNFDASELRGLFVAALVVCLKQKDNGRGTLL